MTTATFNFAVDEAKPGSRPFTFVTRVDTDLPLEICPQQIDLANIRTLKTNPTVEREGFAVERVPAEELDGRDGWEERYMVAMGEWLRAYLEAKRCFAFNYQIREREHDPDQTKANNPDAEDADGGQPSLVAHIDCTEEIALIEALKQTGYSEIEARNHRLALFNIWRPLRGPVKDSPLALCDAQSIEKSDLVETKDAYGRGYFLRHNSRQKWLYLKDQTPDEILIFRGYDNTISDNAVAPHSAFLDPRYSTEFRRSIEVRMIAEY